MIDDVKDVGKTLGIVQSGFLENRQTKDNICFITQKILEQFNTGKKVCGIFSI